MYSTLGDYAHLPQQAAWIRALTDGGIFHHGIYVGNDKVIHARKGHGVTLTSLTDFAYGKPVEIVKTPSNPIHCSQVLQRSRSCLGVPYHLLAFNCEHFSSWAWGEQPHSEQLATAAFVAIGAGLTYWAMSEG